MEQAAETQSRIAVLENETKNVIGKLEEIRKEQKEMHTSLSKEQKEIFTCLMDKFENVSKRIAVLERWRWMIFGGAIVVGYILAHVKIEKLF
jgi:uncharacterized coiled-coil DUF342 family protein